MEFKDLDLHPDLLKGVEEAGFTTCMPVQEAVFPHGFAGRDIYAQSQTGTGKTAAFLLSIFQRIMTVPECRHRKVLILAPTRELAVQIEGETEKLGKYLSVSSAAFYGGVGYGPQVDALRDNVQMIIGTPGRIIDLVKQGKMLLREVGFLVIDEADRMFDMGFIDDLRKLIRYLPPPEQRQTFLFSATLGLRIKDLAWEYMVKPQEIVIEPEQVTVELVTQELYHVGSHEKMGLLLGILEREKPESAIIFCNQKMMVEELARRLKINGIDCEYIMGDLPQSKRLEIIERLKAGELRILVATDVAARGLDIEALDLVVNYDLPDDTESYVHRIGRTARAGKSGKAISLACEKFVFNLPSIEKFIGMKIPVAPYDQALMLADKSRGMRLHRPPEGRGRPGGRDARAGRDANHGRDARAGRDAGFGREGGRRQVARPEGTRQVARPERGPAKPQVKRETAEAGSENPYALSQDERLKHYKERYGQSPASGEGRRDSSRGDSSRGDGSRGPGRGEAGRGGEGRGEQGGARRHDGRGPSAPQSPRRGGAPAPHGRAEPRPADARVPGKPVQAPVPSKSANKAPSASQSPAPQAAKKPGILDRIKGLFRGKKGA